MEKAEKGLIITRARSPKKPGTVAIDKYRMQHLVAHFGDKPAKDIARSDCQRCLEKLMAGQARRRTDIWSAGGGIVLRS